MFIVKAGNFDDGYTKFNDFLFWNNKYQYLRTGVTAHSFGDAIIFENAECTLNLHDLNYTKSKWAMLIRLYLDPHELGMMVTRLLHYKSKRKRIVYIPDIAMSFKNRKNASGACLLSMSVGFHSGHWYCTVTTRANELTTRWYADLIFIHVLLKKIGEYVGFTPKDIQVRWNMTSNYQSITGIPFFLVRAGHEEWLVENKDNPDNRELTEWQSYTLKRYVKSFLNKGYRSFRTQNRMIEAYEILKGEMIPKGLIYTEDLSLPGFEINHVLEALTPEELSIFNGGADDGEND